MLTVASEPLELRGVASKESQKTKRLISLSTQKLPTAHPISFTARNSM